MSTLSTAELLRALTLRDLSDPAHGPHAMQRLLAEIHARLHAPVTVHRASPIVSIADNYDRLGYPPDGAARDARYTRYVCEGALLRTQTSAMLPPLLRGPLPDDGVLSCPGLVYRRDVIDRHHVGEPHQVDLWHVARRPLDLADLHAMIATIVGTALPGMRYRTQAADHPYTTNGLQIDVEVDDDWIEIGECGLASRALLPDTHWGLAMGLGLDRLVMLRKRIPDIRLLRASDPRIATQMFDLAPYRAVSLMPPVRRDMSIAIAPLDGEEPPCHKSEQLGVLAEVLGDRIRNALGDRSELLESVDLVSITPYAQLHDAARARLGISPDQANALVRITLRALDRSLTHDECNALRDDVYRAIHAGTVHHWTCVENQSLRADVPSA